MVRAQVLQHPTMTIRCAIYTRKSTEDGLDQEFNSLQAQRDALLDQDGDHTLITKGVDFEITIASGQVYWVDANDSNADFQSLEVAIASVPPGSVLMLKGDMDYAARRGVGRTVRTRLTDPFLSPTSC